MEDRDVDLQQQGKLVTIRGQQGVKSSSAKQGDALGQDVSIGRVERGDANVCRVITIDGLAMEVPTESLEEFVPEKPEDGGFDVLFPTDEISSFEVAMDASACLNSKGYCVVQMSEKKDVIESLKQELRWYTSDFVSPPLEFEEEYLGKQPESKVAFLKGNLAALKDEAGTSIGYCMRCLSQIGSLLISNAADFLHVSASCEVGNYMIRQNFEDKRESRALSSEALTEEQKHDGAVSEFVDFLQRRKLCCMYFVTCEGGTIELTAKQADNGKESVTLPALGGKMLLLQPDFLDYAFKPSGAHIIMQGWVLSEPRHICLEEVVGTEEKIRDVIGATAQFNQPMSRGDDIHIIAATVRAGCQVMSVPDIVCMYQQLGDCGVKVPNSRWDHDLYYTPEETGKGALCQHFSAADNQVFFSFDHEYFGMTYEEAASIQVMPRLTLEGASDIICDAGFTLETVRGKQIDFYDTNQSKEADQQRKWAQSITNERWAAHYSGSDLVAYILGLTGKVKFVCTACSASNVAVQLAYQDMRVRRDHRQYHGLQGDEVQSRNAIVTASMFCPDPWPFIGLSQAHMLGRKGRSMTYDNSANGYCRGEGFGGMWLQNDPSVEGGMKRMADIVGGMINQDGRSASLTAPSGPSQALVVKGALADCGRAANTVSITEMHGTGTALGDPVETGSVKAALNQKRFNPLLYQAGKSQTSHHENGAGCQGIIKMTLACTRGIFFANCHLHTLNANIDEANFPALWPTEIGDLGLEYIHAGISSFGFGGTNCRTQIWTSVTKGSRKVANVSKSPELEGMVVAKPSAFGLNKIDLDEMDVVLTTCPRCHGGMCWTCGESDESIGKGKHYCTQIRDEPDSYGICSSCYQGGFKSDQRPVAFVGNVKPVYIIGSWSDWAEYEEVQQTDDGAYVHAVRLGSSRFEQFRLVLDKDPFQTLYPVTDKAGPRTRIEGPGYDTKDRSWLIDDRERDVPDGMVYRIQFDWDYDQKSIGWEAVLTDEQKVALSKVVDQELFSKLTRRRDGFSIVGSFAGWVPKPLIQNENDEKLWETSFEIGRSGKAEFQFLLDEDSAKAIYPAGAKVVDTSVLVRGPDAGGKGRHWLVVGAWKEMVSIQLRVSDGSITLTTTSATAGERIWRSKPIQKHRYYIVGTWTEWQWSESEAFELKPDPLHPTIYRCQLTLGQRTEEFQISVDKDWDRMYHPTRANNIRASSFVQGPDNEGHGCNWSLEGRIGSRVSVVLDLSSNTKGPSVSYEML